MLRSRLLTPLLFLSLLTAPAHATLLAEAAVRTSVFGDLRLRHCLQRAATAHRRREQ